VIETNDIADDNIKPAFSSKDELIDMNSNWLGKVIGHMPDQTEMDDYSWE
jgi:hypothetical protein